MLPASLLEVYRRMRLVRERRRNARRDVQSVFEEIYAHNRWGGQVGEFCSGSGSDVEFARQYAQTVVDFMQAHALTDVVDLGCGDFRVGGQIARPGIRYTGVDVVRALVERNQRQFASQNVCFVHADICADNLPQGQVCLIRQVLQHLSNAQVKTVLDKALGQFRYVLVTEHMPGPGSWVRVNLDKPHGPDTRLADDSGLFLDQPPFNYKLEKVVLSVDAPKSIRRTGEKIVTYLLAGSLS